MSESLVYFAADHIITVIAEEFKALSDVKSEAIKLGSELEVVMSVAFSQTNRNKELADNERAGALKDELRKIVYEAEDMVDTFVSEYETKAFVGNLLRHVHFKSPRVKKIKKVLEMIEEVKERLMPLYNVESGHDKEASNSPKLRGSKFRGRTGLQAHRRADDDFVVGIEEDVDNLVNILVGNSEEDDLDQRSGTNSQPVDVLAIVGMGGSGKTTLAWSVYNHPKVQNHFKHRRPWVQLSHTWDDSDDEKKLLNELLQQMGVTSEIDDQNLESSRAQIKTLLSKEPCLIVLDDVWHWEHLEKILPTLLIQRSDDHASSSSVSSTNTKIVITSRQYPQLPPSTPFKWGTHYTRFLSDEHSWQLFDNLVSTGDYGKKLAREYQGLAIEMLQKCKGLPLAIVALGTLLKTKDTILDWKRVFAHLQGKEGPHLYKPVNDILALSYEELPDYLKPCFLYLGLLAENSTINAGSLTRMWIAEGFVKGQQREGETSDETANRFLQELVDHTMVQVVTKTYTGKVSTIQVHDIMKDLCIRIAQELEFLTVISSDIEQLKGINSRRAAINLSKCSIPLTAINPSIRSLILFTPSNGMGVGKHGSRVNQQRELDLVAMFDMFKLLRVLDIYGINSPDGTLPKEIGGLIHLRYLKIRSTNIRVLPKSIGKLRKLLTLDYWEVSTDLEVIIPGALWRMESLKHIFLPGEMMGNNIDDLRFEALNDLQTLWGIKGGKWMLEGMDTLRPFLTKLCIQAISSYKQLKAVFKSPVIKENDRLYALALDWNGFSLESLHEFRPRENLKKLRLMGRAREDIKPLTFPSSLWKLELYYTHLKQQETIDALGELAHLKYLGLNKDSFIGTDLICKENAFPKLEELKLSKLPKLEEWKIQRGSMPCLKKLSIISCISLKQIPKGLKSLSTLETLEITHMPTNFTSRLRIIKIKGLTATTMGGEDLDIVKHIPKRDILDSYTPLIY